MTSPVPADQLRELSLRLEKETGFDSIQSIERVYDQTERGAYTCCFPGCGLSRRDAAEMWRHVHFSPIHGLSFGVTDPAELMQHA